jgi:hypothetical protein
MTASRLGLFTAIYWLERGEREQSRAIVDDVARWSRRLPHDVWMRRYLAAFEALYAYRWRAPADAAEALDAALAEIEIEIEVDIKIDSANASDGDSAEPDAERRGFRYAVSLLCARADVQRALGDVDGARATAAQALERAQTAVTASPWDHSVALRTMAQLVGLRDTEPSGAGHLGDGAIGEAEDMAAEAREIAETHGQALNRAKAIWVQAQLRRRAGRDADQLFAEACDAFAALRCAELAELVARDRDRRKSRDISAVRPFGEAARP